MGYPTGPSALMSSGIDDAGRAQSSQVKAPHSVRLATMDVTTLPIVWSHFGESSKLEQKNMHELVLVGGLTEIPKMQSMI